MKPNCDLPITREKYGPTHKGLGLGLLSCWPNTDCVEPASITDQSAVLIRPKRKRNNEIDALRCVATDQSAAAALIIRGRGRRDLIGKDRQRFDAERFRASMYANEPTYWRWGSCFIELWVGGICQCKISYTPLKCWHRFRIHPPQFSTTWRISGHISTAAFSFIYRGY